jgi:outer membrane protein
MSCSVILFLAVLGAEAEAPQAQATPPVRVLTLDEALRAAAGNPSLRQAAASVSGAEARADEARSGLLPQLSGTASYQRATNNVVPRQGIPGTFVAAGSSLATSDFWNANANLSQLVFDFWQTPNRWRAARTAAQAQGDTLQATRDQVLFNVRNAFFQARATKAVVGVSRDTLANQERHLVQVQGFVEVGTRPAIDLAQARTDRANSRVQLINAENNYELARAGLNQAMGVEGSIDYDVADDALPAVPGEEQSTDALLAEALSTRPDVSALALQARAQEQTIAALRGGYLPSLSVGGTVSDAGRKLDQLRWNGGVGATLSWPIFQGGLTQAQVHEAEANLANLQAQMDTLRQQVRLQVDQARLTVRAASAAVGAADEALVNARERLRLAEGRYAAGSGSIIELEDAQLAVTTAAGQRVQAEYNLATARAQLIQALGRDRA